MSHSLNDTCRFWLALASNPDVVDDPQGLRHPLAERGASIGLSPGQFSEACRTFQKIRAEKADERSEDGGVGHSLRLQVFDAAAKDLDLGQDKSPRQGGKPSYCQQGSLINWWVS